MFSLLSQKKPDKTDSTVIEPSTLPDAAWSVFSRENGEDRTNTIFEKEVQIVTRSQSFQVFYDAVQLFVVIIQADYSYLSP